MDRIASRNPFDIPSSQVRSRLRAGIPIFVSLNPIEYHGPHLSPRNDGLVARRMGERCYARLRDERPDWDEFLWAELDMGVDAVKHPGSVFVAYPDFLRLVRRLCEALMNIGAERVILWCFHGAPRHNQALMAGVDMLRAAGIRALSPMALLMPMLIEPPEEDLAPVLATIPDAALRDAVRRSLPYDFHAGFLETSVSLHYVPETLDSDYQRVPPCPDVEPNAYITAAARLASGLGKSRAAAAIHATARAHAWFSLKPFPGYAGIPAAANPRAGALLADLIEEGFVRAVQRAFAGEPLEDEWLMRMAQRFSLSDRFA